MYHDGSPRRAPRLGGMMTAEASGWSRQFTDFGGRAYLDCAAQGPLPRDTSEAIRGALRLQEHPEEITAALFEDLPGRVRAAAARLIGCAPGSIAIGIGASHGINVAARGLPLRSGDEVLLSEGEFAANVFPWLNLEDRGVTVRVVPASPGRVVEAERLIGAIGPRTRLIAVSQVAFATGYRVDLQAIGEACRARGLFLVVDGAQGIGALDFRVADCPIDVLAVSGYKWLLGPYGTGFTYVSPRVLDQLRVRDVNWQAVEGATHFNRRMEYRLQFREGARRFDVPETAAFLNLAGFAASVELLNRVRMPTVEAHARRLLDRLLLRVEATRLRVVSDLKPERRSAILALEGGSLEETRRIYRRLLERGVVLSLRDNLIRVAPHLYNTSDDIDRFLEAAAG
jgi:selenocysteine lyase/cysteine desulfurase